MPKKHVDLAFTAVVTVLPVLNNYKVPKSQWRKWNQVQRQLFNDTYSFMINNQREFLHPKVSPVLEEYWTTTAWNASWIAADSLKKNKLVKVYDAS